MDSFTIFIVGIVIFVVLVISVILFVWVIFHISSCKKMNEKVDFEINGVLEELEYPNYIWNKPMLYEELKNEVKKYIIDIQKKYPRLVEDNYIDNSPRKSNKI